MIEAKIEIIDIVIFTSNVITEYLVNLVFSEKKKKHNNVQLRIKQETAIIRQTFFGFCVANFTKLLFELNFLSLRKF